VGSRNGARPWSVRVATSAGIQPLAAPERYCEDAGTKRPQRPDSDRNRGFNHRQKRFNLLEGALIVSETVSLDYEIKSPIERVWHALTNPATLMQWMFFETEDFQPVVGHHFQFRGKAATGWTGVVDCEVLVAEVPHRLSYRWVTAGQKDLHQTIVTWTLTAVDHGVTQLHLEQTGFDSAAKQEIGGARYGWTHQLDQLETLLSREGRVDEP